MQQAIQAGQYLKDNNKTIDIAFTSLLSRAIHTTEIICNTLSATPIPIHRSWTLNDRHTGALTGMTKNSSTWIRTFDTAPPPIDEDHSLYDVIQRDPRYKDVFADENEIPRSESVENSLKRALTFWNTNIVPEIQAGKNVLVVSHSNVMRGFIKHFENLPADDILHLHVKNSLPFVYEFNERLEPIGPLRYLY